jgi:hypothetical protein
MNVAVWRTTSDVMRQLFSQWEAETPSPSIDVQAFEDTTMKVALLVLCRAGNHVYLLGGPLY